MKKLNTILFLLLIISVFCISFVFAKEKLPFEDKIIYLDAGHGGLDPGAINNKYEKDIVLTITKKLAVELEKQGATVYMTRYDDYDLAAPHLKERKLSDLQNRARLINNSDCDLYLSIHLNADSSSKYRGAQVFYTNKNDNNKELANEIQKVFRKQLYSSRNIQTIRDLYLYRNIKKPGVLLELGFISNPNDFYLLNNNDHQMKVINSIISGLKNYFSK